jgi:hypothetical protein
MLAPYGLNLYFYILFMDHVQEKSEISITRQKINWSIFLSTRTPIKHHNKTPFYGKPKPQM